MPAYHGTLSLDPETGAIRRITVEAGITGTDVVKRADIAVEYGSVDIGGRSYICPLRGLALSVDHYHPGLRLQEPIARINEVRFVNYHKFGSTSRILSGDAIASSHEQGDSDEDGSAPPSASVADLGESSIATPPAAPFREGAPNSKQAPTPSQQDRIGTEEQPLLIQTPVFKTQAQNVLVDVVVTQSNGDPVLNLSRDDFAVREDGKAERIAFFDVHRAAIANTHSTRTPETAASPSERAPRAAETNDSTDSVNVILLDWLNTSQQSQVLVREKLNAFFRKMAPNQRVALFALAADLRCVQGFTTDASVLVGALNDKKKGIFPDKIEAGWRRDDEMEKEAEITRLKKTGIQSTQAVRAALERLAAAKRQKQMAMTLEAIDDLAQLLGGIPGRKNLLWFAETFPVRLSPVLPGGENPASPTRSNTSGETMVQEYIDKVKEVSHKVTAARIAVYPIQAEGMMEEHLFEANLASPGSEEENLSIRRANSGAIAKEEKDSDAMYSHKAGSQERADTIMAMEQLAAETGGEAFFNTNALDTAAARAVAHGASYYTIGYSPTNEKMDGQYRRIEVTVRGKYGLSYRRGYFADSKSAKTADTESRGNTVSPAGS
jgi:VWFA-related protein